MGRVCWPLATWNVFKQTASQKNEERIVLFIVQQHFIGANLAVAVAPLIYLSGLCSIRKVGAPTFRNVKYDPVFSLLGLKTIDVAARPRR